MKLYTEDQVKELLAEQRHNCQIERNKRSILKKNHFYLHADDVKNAEQPTLPVGTNSEQIWNTACKAILKSISDTLLDEENLKKVDRISDKDVIMEIGETIKDFPIPKFKV